MGNETVLHVGDISSWWDNDAIREGKCELMSRGCCQCSRGTIHPRVQGSPVG